MAKKITYNKFVRNTIVFSILTILAIFALYGKYFQASSIEKSIKADTQVMADLVFQNLYTIMNNGGDIKTIDEAILRIEKSVPHVDITIVKDIKDAKKEIVNRVFESKVSEIERHDNHIDFATPILYKNECIKCHVTSEVNDVAGVVQIEHPILELKIAIKEILFMALILFVIIIIVFFTFWYRLLSKYFVEPIKNLIIQIDNSTSHHDLKTQIVIDTTIEEIKHLEHSFNKQNKDLLESYQKIVDQSNTDVLTQIFNRKKFDEYSQVFLGEAKRYNHIFSLVMLDLNKFKPINDTYGHDVGDKVLIFFSSLVSSLIRESDFFFRTGGDEFILLLPNTDYQQAIRAVNKIKDKLKNNPFVRDDLSLEISASFGISQYNENINDINMMIKNADENMYEDKKLYNYTR